MPFPDFKSEATFERNLKEKLNNTMPLTGGGFIDKPYDGVDCVI